jgi:L-fucose mutarotase/ribose pyranase (RbsD/FucU family)
MALLEAILTVMPLDRAVPHAIMRAALNNDPAQSNDFHKGLDAACARLAPDFEVKPLAGADLYPRIRAAHTIIATTEPALFANVIRNLISADLLRLDDAGYLHFDQRITQPAADVGLRQPGLRSDF